MHFKKVNAAAVKAPITPDINRISKYDMIPPLCEDGMGNEVEFPTFILHHLFFKFYFLFCYKSQYGDNYTKDYYLCFWC